MIIREARAGLWNHLGEIVDQITLEEEGQIWV